MEYLEMRSTTSPPVLQFDVHRCRPHAYDTSTEWRDGCATRPQLLANRFVLSICQRAVPAFRLIQSQRPGHDSHPVAYTLEISYPIDSRETVSGVAHAGDAGSGELGLESTWDAAKGPLDICAADISRRVGSVFRTRPQRPRGATLQPRKRRLGCDGDLRFCSQPQRDHRRKRGVPKH